MHLGLSSYTYPWAVGVPGHEPAEPLTASALLDRAIEQNVGAVQFGDNLPLHTLPAADWHALRERAWQHHIQLEVGMRGLTAANLKTYIRLAWEARSPFLRVVIDDAGYEPGVDEIVAIINDVLPTLQRAGVILAIENHDRLRAETLKRIALQTSLSWVGFCVDTTNSLGGGETVAEVLHALEGTMIVNLHVKDFVARRVPTKMGFVVEGCAPGTGLLRLDALLSSLYGVAGRHDRRTYSLNGYPQPVTLTLEQWPPFQNTLEETILTEAEWAETGLRWLRKQLTPILQ